MVENALLSVENTANPLKNLAKVLIRHQNHFFGNVINFNITRRAVFKAATTYFAFSLP